MTSFKDRVSVRLADYAKRWLITSWVVLWIIAAAVATELYETHPQSLRFVIALGFILGSVAGDAVFIPFALRDKMRAFTAVIAIGIFANLLMGVAFLLLALTSSVVAPSWQATGFYMLMLPGSIMWFSGGVYLFISQWCPEMRDVSLSMRPWRSSRETEETEEKEGTGREE